MATRRPLTQISEEEEGLGLPTIMDRALAAEHGVPYVHLAVFCIDIDRLHHEHLDDEQLPFGWEVFLTGYFLRGVLSPEDPETVEILSEMSTSILEAEPGHGVLGSQVVFAVHTAATRGDYPSALRKSFGRWKGAPAQLAAALEALWRDAEQSSRRLAEHCLTRPMQPPLAPPTLESLEKMARGGWTLY